MNNIVRQAGALAIGALIMTGCTHRIAINHAQAVTMSPQAVDTLKRFKVVRLPIIHPKDKMLIKARQKFSDYEAGELKTMMEKFHPGVADTVIGGVLVKVITPATINPAFEGKIAIYIHGGGFILGSATDRMGMLMINEMGIKTYSIDYHLAPEAKFPVAMDECVTVYRGLLQQYKPNDITGFSCSAGCTHMLAMLIKAKQEGLPMINSIALFSPATDISGNGDAMTANDGRDMLANKNSADKMFAAPFIGKASATAPLVSPVYATYTSDFPPSILLTSTRDLFLSNTVRLYWKLRAVHVSTELVVAEGMWHAFQSYTDIPEAVENRKAAEDFLYKRMAPGGEKTNADGTALTDTSRNIQLVKRFIDEVVNGGDINLIAQLWSNDLVWHGGSLGEIKGLANYENMARSAVNGSFTNMHLTILDVIAANDKVVVYFQNSGKNEGNFLGHPATGKTAHWYGMGIYRIENSKIAEGWFSEDLLQMFTQLGYLKN
jgi:acetyl esterase/lipase/predicted ester cyclase